MELLNGVSLHGGQPFAGPLQLKDKTLADLSSYVLNLHVPVTAPRRCHRQGFAAPSPSVVFILGIISVKDILDIAGFPLPNIYRYFSGDRLLSVRLRRGSVSL